MTGGVVYRGERYPEMRGSYFFGDFCSGVIWAMVAVEDGTWAVREVARPDSSPVAFGSDVSGNLLVGDRLSDSVFAVRPIR